MMALTAFQVEHQFLEALLLLIIVNKALEEVCGRRINKDDFFHPEQLLNALNLIEQWLKTDSYFLERVH